jgi:uncharacterized protein (UPF0332 family)
MADGTSTAYLKQKLARGREDLADARNLYQRGNYRLSITRAYYAVFHVVSAALNTIGQDRSKHSGVEAAFHQYLIKPGLINVEHGTTFKMARKWREDADYGVGLVFTEETARDILEQCERLVQRLESYLYETMQLEDLDDNSE